MAVSLLPLACLLLTVEANILSNRETTYILYLIIIMPLITLYSNVSCGWLWFLIGMRLRIVGSFSRSSIIERCKTLNSLASLSFLRLAGFKIQNTVGTESDLSVALFSRSKYLHYAGNKILLGKMMTADTSVIIIYWRVFQP